MVYENALDMIGNTPLLKLKNLVTDDMADVYVKLEKFNPGGSIKDRAALGMIEKAEAEGKLKKGYTIVEPTSGNMGIGLAMIGKLKGYNVIIVMPDTMSIERRSLLAAYGAKVVLTQGINGMRGAIEKAEEIAEGKKDYFIPQQFTNEANPLKNYETTAEEIIKDVPQIDAFVAAVGTGGTLIGTGKKLKEYNSNIKVIAVEPKFSQVLSGGKPGNNKIQGIGADFVPEIFKREYVDEILTAADDEAFKTAAAFAKEEGILVGISAGANVSVALKIAKKLGRGKIVVTVAPDGGEKYLSSGLYE